MRFACPGLLQILKSGATVIVPSQLIAAVVSNEFARERLDNAVESWETPDIYSANTWLRVCAQRVRYAGHDVPAVLSRAQEQALWKRIIADHTPGLFDVASTAALASQAARLIAEWNIPLEGEAWDEHQDGEHFRRWLTAFQDRCKEAGWRPAWALWWSVPNWVANGFSESRSVVFAGFVHKPPALSRLRHALGSAARFVDADPTVPGVSISVQSCKEFAEEIEYAARGARSAFERDPASLIGVFVPDLRAHCSIVERIFSQVFYPSEPVARLYGACSRKFESVFHVHGAPLLRDEPLVAAAMLLLDLAIPRIPIGEASAILHSPWIGGAAKELNERALADFELRRFRELDVGLNDLHYSAKSCPLFQRMLQRVADVLRHKPVRAELAVWSELFSELLSAVDWPGDRELSQEQRELVERWKEKLSDLASLSLVVGRVSVQEATAELRSLLAEPGSAVGDFFSPIQILDPSDATALRFDQTFATGVSEENSLFKPAISPLIPLRLQRACDIPGATPSSLHNHHKLAFADIIGSAPQVCFSYSNRIHPAAEAHRTQAVNAWPAWEGRTPRQSFVPVELEAIEDQNAPPYRGGGRSLGGTGLIKDQSQCPFRAFAVRRLYARAPEEGSFGLDSRDRGGFAHEALRIVWEQIKSQQALRKIAPLELQFLVNDAVAAAVGTRDKGPLHEQLSFVEMDRLAQVILEWLEIERQRRLPFEVEVVEQERELSISGLHLNIRIDRIDRLKNKKCLLIDYKSGKTSAADLDGVRPAQPQLLAYAAAMRNEVDGIFFGQLKPREIQLNGYARDVHIRGQKPPGKDLSWNDYLKDRIDVVERLAESFVRGEAAVAPIPGACDYCDVAPLCRINEIRWRKRDKNVGE